MAIRPFFRSLAALISGKPERGWPDVAVLHGTRVAMLLLLGLVVVVFFPVVPVPDFPVLEEGMVAEEDIIAQVGFPIYKSEADLAREREEAAAGVPPVFDLQPDAVERMTGRVERFFERVDSAATSSAVRETAAAAVRAVLRDHGFRASDAYDFLLGSAQRAQLEAAVTRTIETELPRGYVFTPDLEEYSASQLRVRRGERERLMPRDSILTQADFYNRSSAYVPTVASADVHELQRLVLIRFFEPSLTLNVAATEEARERARQAVPTIKAEVLRGERIVAAHEQVRDADLERLHAYHDYLVATGQLGGGIGGVRTVGSFLYAMTLLLIFGMLLYFFRPQIYYDFRHILLLSLLILTLLAAAAIIGRNDLPIELIPIAVPALAVAALWDGRLALNLALVLALLIGGQSPFGSMSGLFTMAVGGAAAALSVRVVRRRAQTWVFGLVIALAYAGAALTLGLLRARETMEVVMSGGWGALNGFASALVAMGVLPLLESFTRITTDQTLLELSDLNHPLLRRLSREAPGTFSHSLSVANLAESAAHAIGANPLLTRVGVYYHDVGKIAKPQYFIENQPKGRNPHDKLKPSSSAAVVRNHIFEGLRLADEHKLPDCIKDFILEHHGTQQISFFYERALELEPEVKHDASTFAYPGPRPQSKETAIAMLADSVESATRALSDPTPQRIRELVDRVVAGKLRQGQLDQAPLTLLDLSEIKRSLSSLLSGMYHQRIDYPPAPPPGERPAQQSGARQPQPTAGTALNETSDAAAAISVRDSAPLHGSSDADA
ncbi:MAG: HD family phosphohydrolase [Longimicrobiales bacterium]